MQKIREALRLHSERYAVRQICVSVGASGDGSKLAVKDASSALGLAVGATDER